MDARTFRCLSKYLFFKKNIQLYFREIDFKNICAKNIENGQNINIEIEGFIRYLYFISLVFQ